MYKRLLKIPFVSLPNLIANKSVVPEMLMHMCTPDSVDNEFINILPGTEGRQTMISGYKLMKQKLGTEPAAQTAAIDIVDYLKKNNH